MASIECSSCGNGIHYHDIPDGTEYILFPVDFWESLKDYKFDVQKAYTRIKSDAIELEFTEAYHKMWKCPKCKSLIVFENGTPYVKAVYSRCSSYVEPETKNMQYIVFSDRYWDMITEGRVPIEQLPIKHKGEFFIVCSDGLYWVYRDESLCNLVCTYSLNKIATDNARQFLK